MCVIEKKSARACMCVCVCVCVCESERERESGGVCDRESVCI